MRHLAVALVCAGCSSVLGIEELEGPGDGGVPQDRPTDVIVGPQLRISGTAQQISGPVGGQGIANAQIELVTQGSDSRPEITSSGLDGTFTLLVDTRGMPVDGYLRMTDLSGNVVPSDTFFVEPLTRDTEVVLQGFDRPTLDMLGAVCGAAAAITDFPVYIVAAVDAAKQPVAGVTIKSTPNGVICIDNGNPQPGNITGPSGIGFVFGIPPGAAVMTVGATSRSVVAEPATTMFVPVLTSPEP
ncbi:MAG: hypothetical protein ABI867_01995 [Kofleriaceae bacterium]